MSDLGDFTQYEEGHLSEEKRIPSPVMASLSTQMKAFLDHIVPVNTPGNIEGLFAFHIVNGETEFPLSWNVDCATEEWLVINHDRVNHVPVLGAIGYTLQHFAASISSSWYKVFIDGLGKLRQRDPFPDDRISFAYQPIVYLGIALGVCVLGEAGTPYRTWLLEVLTDRRCSTTTYYHTLLYRYIRYVLTGEPMVIHDMQSCTYAQDLALLEWGVRHHVFQVIEPHTDLSWLQTRVLQTAMILDTSTVNAPQAAILWSSIYASLTRSLAALVLSHSHVSTILQRFEAALRRWRWDNSENVKRPIRWEIKNEREIQDIVWLILRSVFDDVIDEETLPKFGHSTYKADFGIPSLQLLVEVKYTRESTDFKKIEKEIMEDACAYLLQTKERYKSILVFIYDASSSVQEHNITINAIRKLPNILDVIIVSRPSQLPE